MAGITSDGGALLLRQLDREMDLTRTIAHRQDVGLGAMAEACGILSAVADLPDMGPYNMHRPPVAKGTAVVERLSEEAP